MKKHTIGPNGERRPISVVQNAIKAGRISVGLESEQIEASPPASGGAESPVLLGGWKRPAAARESEVEPTPRPGS